MSELLFEIGTEELPAGYIDPALRFLAERAGRQFAELGLEYGECRTAGTPRRLTLMVEGLQDKQPDRIVRHTGPSRQAGFDKEGNPTRAAQGFAASKGMRVEDLQVVKTAKGDYLEAMEEVKGRGTAELLPELLTGLIREIVFPKSMRWGQGSITFARPIQWLLALFDGRVVKMSVDSLSAGATTRGHRFMAAGPIAVSGWEDYLSVLRDRHVLADPRERREAVLREVRQAMAGIGGGEVRPILEEQLVDTVTNLVEVPWGVCGRFDEKFLELPDEVLITSMREHQKYFPAADRQGRLLPYFVAVNNTRIEDAGLAVSGHQRVLRARLEDALFFFREDKKKKLSDRSRELAGIVFHHKLGSMLAKAERTARLAGRLATTVEPTATDYVLRTAMLAKCDLLTAMVGEFPSLQGIMGREYALLDGEPAEVAFGIHEHYLPVRAGGQLPERMVGALVGIADRLDTLAGCFAIGEKPTGTTDPFGLRRQALGLLHIIQGRGIHLSLTEVIGQALTGYRDMLVVPDDTGNQLLEFIRLRFENDLVTAGFKLEVVTAATAAGFDNVVDCRARVEALDNIRGREQFSVLAGSFKRIRNIVKGNRDTAIDEALLTDEAEVALYATLVSVRSEVEPLLAEYRYHEALEFMLRMKDPVDLFFDQVMVMTDKADVRQNRLNLLTALGELVLQIGDISRMHLEAQTKS